MKLAGASFTVVGAGRSGVAAANALANRGGDVRLVEIRAEAPRPAELSASAAFEAGTNAVRPGDVAVLSPGIPEVSPLREEIARAASEVIGEIELFYRLCPAPILAVTGTDGKSTVTTMLGAICEQAGHDAFVGGNLGNPLCEGLDSVGPESLVVAEISCFQLTSAVEFRPRVAVITNIAEDHVDYHGGFQAYQAAKRRIWRRMTTQDVLIVNGDDPNIATWELPRAPTIRRFSLRDRREARIEGESLVLEGVGEGEAETIMERAELPLLGPHNVANALAAGLAARSWGIPIAAIRGALLAYRALPHRLETVATVGGVTWIDDSKATNPNAATAGVGAIEGPLVLLAGGSSKDADFSGFAALIRARTRHAVLFGQTRHAIAEAVGPNHPVTVVDTLERAVEVARALARPGDTALLSPACASFDQFRSYAHRGEVFSELVRAMAR